MHNKLQSVFDQSEINKKKFIDLVESFSDEQQSFKPNGSSWSMKEVAYHLYIVEKLTLKFMANFSFERKNEALGLSGKLRTFALKWYFNFMPRLKAPANPAIAIPVDVNFVSVLEDWSKVRVEMNEFLSLFPNDKLNHFIYKHPFAGKVNIVGTIVFFAAHLNHHQKQIERIMKSDNFPA